MPQAPPSLVAQQFVQALTECRQLYVQSGEMIANQYPDLILGGTPAEFVEMMDELHKALVVRVFSRMAMANNQLGPEQIELAAILIEHIWQQRLSGDKLLATLRQVSHQASGMIFYSLVRPFDQIIHLRNRIGPLITVVMRLANLVAKADGTITEFEAENLRSVQRELETHLVPLTLDASRDHEEKRNAGRQAVEQSRAESSQLRVTAARKTRKAAAQTEQASPSLEELLAQAKAQLSQMIGLATVKREIETLANFLRIQQHRKTAGLPQTRLSLHMVFSGNPGTGKTTVARILGQIFHGLKILEKGHLIETDRSGLVAQYVGQTGPKSNKIIDEAMDGVLFIDEAYSLVAEQSEDAFGREALQTLLKRMEDDRERLVVIMAGYSEPMERLLKVNPGLSSRVNYRLGFEDYDTVQLCQIFQLMCDQNRYRLPPEVRIKLLDGFKWLYENRDEHFGNGRLARNVFETAIRRLADRVAGTAPVTVELLTVLHPQDIEMPDVPWDAIESVEASQRKYRTICPECGRKSRTQGDYFGRKVQCAKCQHGFTVEWGEPL